jgi:hypothetical protein
VNVDNHSTPEEEKTNGNVEESKESCDKKDDNSAASDVVVTEQQQQNNKNGKTISNTNIKKNKKNAKGKVDNDEIGSEVKA